MVSWLVLLNVGLYGYLVMVDDGFQWLLIAHGSRVAISDTENTSTKIWAIHLQLWIVGYLSLLLHTHQSLLGAYRFPSLKWCYCSASQALR